MDVQELTESFSVLGYVMPLGLKHLLFHRGSSRKEVYRSLWGSLRFVAKLDTKGHKTLVYPEEIRDAVRCRFPDSDAGSYDRQYHDQGHHVTMEDLARATWKPPPANCQQCHPPAN